MNSVTCLVEKEVETDYGHLEMQRLGKLLIDAANLPNNYNGMKVSMTGALSNAARTLKMRNQKWMLSF